MKKFFIFFHAFWLIGGAWAQTSYVPATRTLFDKGYQLNFGGEVLQTFSVINSDGTTHALPGDHSFTRYQADVGGQYGLTRSLQVGTGARFRHHEARFTDANGSDNTGISSGLQSIFTSLQYSFAPVGQLTYSIDGLFRYTPYTNSEFDLNSSQTKLILGDDGNEYSVGLGVTYSFNNNNFLTIKSGYRKPGQHLSGEIYWQAEGAMVWKHLALIAGVDGVTSLESDPYASDTNNRPIFNTGPSALYNGLNRELIAPYAGLNIALGGLWRLEFKASQVVTGQSTDIARAYGLQLIRRVENYNPTKILDTEFKTYDIEATITKVSQKKEYVVIDKGLADDVQKGMSMDFFEFDFVGGNILIARGTVISTKSDSAVVKITQRFNRKKEIKVGLVGRATLK